ncbi:unnamed protein product, partial [Mesorhabditis spiculigera]
MRHSQSWRSVLRLLLLLELTLCLVNAKLDCDPSSDTKKPDPENPESYLYCNLEGTFSKRKCLSGKLFNAKSGQCESIMMNDSPDDILSQPFFQAPDDLCGTGIPLTILSAPVVCNPSISSCPDGYVCRMYERTGTSYCCQNPSPTIEDQASCSSDQVTYIEPSSGRPRSCVLGDSDTCPIGFGCNLVGGTTTRCCGKDFGCPFNAAGFIHPSTGGIVECNPKSPNSCQNGFQCARSSKFNKYICCSEADGDVRSTQCPNGDFPLANPSRCSANAPCPAGYVCSDEKCCPAFGVCPAGLPLGGGVTVCNENLPCQDGYECVTTGGANYCCPMKEKVCTEPRHSGNPCANSRPAVTRYYFDQSTGSCRSFQFSQCGGNSNNFNSLEECEGYCVDTQCENGQPYRVGAVNAACSMSSLNTCPRQHVCTTPSFGPSPICCPIQELTCNEVVSAGTPCFGKQMTIQRFYFNPSTRKCQPFQYYGCNGNGNNFNSMDQCADFCLNAIDTACGGVAPLVDPNNRAQKCDRAVGCPDGYNCNPEGYCCPETRTSCAAPMSRGNVCAGTAQRTMWYYDTAQQKCRQFLYNGCGGSSNRFTSQAICSSTCLQASTVGQCPRGMTAFVETGDISPKSCTLNVRGTCPDGTSCVRSTSNVPICCQTVHSCPGGRQPYNIPGSNSVVACNAESDTCPRGNACMESSTIAGFHLCCTVGSSNTITMQQRPGKGQVKNNRQPRPQVPVRGSGSLASILKEPTCPTGTTGNGQACTINVIGGCPSGHLCLRQEGQERGTCCKLAMPKCGKHGYLPVLLTSKQVQICDQEEFRCPSDAECQNTNQPDVTMCCEKYEGRNRSGKKVPAHPRAPTPQPGSSNQFGIVGAQSIHEANAGRCRNGDRPYRDEMGMVLQCNAMNAAEGPCPQGFKCEFSNAGLAVCCADLQSIRCPAPSTPYEVGGRPLACPPGSTKCPNGYTCVPSENPLHHLCCSDGGPRTPTCAAGVAYTSPMTKEKQFCSPLRDSCPTGFHCLESTMPGQFICCTQGDLGEKFQGYCPRGQIPHVDWYGQPSPCHMSLKPCPNNAPYVCIYSAEKQDSFCCAPLDSTARQYHPAIAQPGMQFNKLPAPSSGLNNFNKDGFNNNNFGNQNGFQGQGNNRFINQPAGPAVPNYGIADLERKELEKGQQVARLIMQQKIQQQQLLQKRVNATVSTSTNGPNGWEVMGVTPEEEYEKALQLGEKIGRQLRLNSLSGNSGCPAGSRALVGTDRTVVTCGETPCPSGFACLFADEVNRWQCCSTSAPTTLPTPPPEANGTETKTAIKQSSLKGASNTTTMPPVLSTECPLGFYNIDGKCLKVLYVGQKGCISDDQCGSKEPNATCDSGYCICPAAKPLVHESKCVGTCPEGFSNIAGRCYDPTTVIFMDSVDERANGTIGGYCMDTLVEEKRCLVKNAYCSEKTVTCTCKPGFELDMADKQGKCVKLTSTKFHEELMMSDAPEQVPELDQELYFIDIAPQADAPAAAEDPARYLLPQTEDAVPTVL